MNPIWKKHNKGRRNLVKTGQLIASQHHDFFHFNFPDLSGVDYNLSGVTGHDTFISTNDTITFLNGDNSDIIGNNINKTIRFDVSGNAAYGLWNEGTGVNAIVADNFNRTGPPSASTHIKASGDYALAIGINTQASGIASLVGGVSSKATGDYSVAFGENCDASGIASLAIGKECDTSGSVLASVALGYQGDTITTVADPSQIIILQRDGGKHENLILSVGYNGNIMELDEDSNLWIKQGGENGFLNIRKLWVTGEGNHSLISHNYNYTDNEALGEYSIAMGINNTARGIASIVDGSGNASYGNYSVAFGLNCDASGEASFVDGSGCVAIGNYSCAIGSQTIARSAISFVGGESIDASGTAIAIGYDINIDGSGCVSLGYNTILKQNNILALGRGHICDGSGSVALCCGNYTFGWCSTAMGEDTRTYGRASTSMGKDGRAIGDYSTVMGIDCSAIEFCNFADGSGSVANHANIAIAMGSGCIASGENSFAMGFHSKASHLNCSALGYEVSTNSPGDGAIVFGKKSQTSGQYSFAGGFQCEAAGNFSVAMGHNSQTTQDASCSYVCGYNCKASGQFSVAMGNSNESSGIVSTAFGEKSRAIGDYTFVVGTDCSASSLGCFVGGIQNNTIGIYSSSAGGINTANGNYSVCFGYENTTTADASFSVILAGKENEINDTYSTIISGFQNKTTSFAAIELTCGERNATINGKWLPDYTISDINQARINFDMAEADDHLYAVGGQKPIDAYGNACATKTVEKYNKENNIWTTETNQLNEYRLPAVASVGTKLYAVGGSGITKGQHTAGIPAHWELHTLDTSGSTGLYTSVAAVHNGNQYISYRSETEKNLKSIEISGNTIIETVVDISENRGLYTSIGVGTVGSSVNTHISYYDSSNSHLRYAEIADGGGVDLYTVDDTSGAGQYTSIDIDVSGTVTSRYISYYDASNGNLKIADLSGSASGTWNLETIDTSGVGQWTSICHSTPDSLFNQFISYYDASNGNLKMG